MLLILRHLDAVSGVFGGEGRALTGTRHQAVNALVILPGLIICLKPPVMVSILPISCARVDVNRDIQWMSAQEMGNMLTITGAKLKADDETWEKNERVCSLMLGRTSI